ncbi:alpha-ribazole phosphatase cobc [Lucifera butyrica]|uniref:Alpha-ribazole phosphatase n=1 Tax=Lucifera butyrica TaxID=1351585 RepID=A0A498R514_9FIRM|nr:alpha-ribazole phosphatase cobc [Lucifera butyrica]
MAENRLIFLVRHGKIELEDEQRRYIGQLDLPLNEAGVRQARGLQKRLAGANIGTIFCSDLIRSRQTAAILAGDKGIAVIPRKELREIDLGRWEGCKFAEIARHFPNEFKARGADIGYYRVPGGESFADCSRRVVAAFHDILTATEGPILLVGHAGVNRVLLCYMLGIPLANLFRISQDYGCLNMIQCSSYGYQVKLVNYCAFTGR